MNGAESLLATARAAGIDLCLANPGTTEMPIPIAATVTPYQYDAIYGAFWNAVIPENAKHAMQVSVARHIEWLEREAP